MRKPQRQLGDGGGEEAGRHQASQSPAWCQQREWETCRKGGWRIYSLELP